MWFDIPTKKVLGALFSGHFCRWAENPILRQSASISLLLEMSILELWLYVGHASRKPSSQTVRGISRSLVQIAIIFAFAISRLPRQTADTYERKVT